MIVYKYLPAEFGIQAIQYERLKVGISNLQNDIFDWYPIIQAGESRSEPEDTRLTEETLQQMAAYYGVLSFCEKADNLMLWAHYGDSHRGMALGIEFSPEAGLLKVNYRPDNKRVIVRKSEIDELSNGIPYVRHRILFERAFNAKGTNWEHESEYRVFITLGACEKVNGLYFVTFSKGEIRQVILGARCSATVEEVWRAFARGEKNNFTILHAQPDPTEFKMKLVRYENPPNESWFWQADGYFPPI